MTETSMAAAVLPVPREALPGLELLADVTLSQAEVAEQAERVWRMLLPELSPRRVVRLALRHADGRLAYPAGAPTIPVTQFPDGPAAMFVYAEDRTSRLWVIDIDTKKRATAAQAAADLAALKVLLASCRARYIEDTGPSGGFHIYVVFDSPRSFDDLSRLTRALLRRVKRSGWHGAIDPASPMTNAKEGLIRPPGSPHRLGGYQTLITPLHEAMRIARRGNGFAVWNALHEELEHELAEVDGESLRPDDLPLDIPARPLPGGRRALPPLMLQIATTGVYPERYPSGHEARQAVLTAALMRGWSLSEVMAAMDDGTFRGLTDLYARYKHPRQILISDWRHANDHENGARGQKTGTTRPLDQPHINAGGKGVASEVQTLTSQARYQDEEGNGYRYIRTFCNAIYIAEAEGTLTIPQRLVLRALAAFAMQYRGQRALAMGVRSLDLGSTLAHSTVSEVLHSLTDCEDPWLQLIEGRRGLLADLYYLQIPQRYLEAVQWRRWRAGRLEAIHRVFRHRELGGAAALVYEALGPEQKKPNELLDRSKVAERTQRDALTRLAIHGLAERDGSGWRRGPVSLDALAASLGIDEDYQRRFETYRCERDAWKTVWSKYHPLETLATLMAGPPAPEPPFPAEPFVDEPPVPAEPAWHTASTPAWLHPTYTEGLGLHPLPPEPPTEDPGFDEDGQEYDHSHESSTAAGSPADTESSATPATPAPTPSSAAAAKARTAKTPAPARRWKGLLPDDRLILEAVFHADQAVEKDENDRRRAGFPARKATEWRPLGLSGDLAAAAGLDLIDESDIPEALQALTAAGLVDLQASIDLTAAWKVEITKTGRSTARAGLGITGPVRPPKGMLRPGTWRLLEQVAKSEPRGVSHERIWKPGLATLGCGTYPRVGRGYIDRVGDQWHLTDKGEEHYTEFAAKYRKLYAR